MIYARWMENIPGTKMVSELTIPGTHDSATYTAKDWAGFGYVKTQTMSFSTQLKTGCRFLDIRCRLFKDHLLLHHGSFYLDLNFTNVINDCKNFLKENPSECILMSLKREYDSDDNTITYQKAFMEYYNTDPTVWHIGDTIPTLDQVRGKIVLLRRFKLDCDSSSMGIDTSFKNNKTFVYQFHSDPNLTLYCEDKYEPGTPEKKRKAILDNVTLAKEKIGLDNLFMTFTSGLVKPKPLLLRTGYTPKGMSKEVNPWMMTHLTHDNKQMGIFACDFMDTKLAHFFVDNNFPVT